MVAVHHLVCVFVLAACSAPEVGELETPSEGAAEAAFEVVTVASASPAPVGGPALRASTSAAEPEHARITEGPCSLPPRRPSSFGVKVLQHVMPHGRADEWFGGELATATNVCPRDPGAHMTAPCTTVTDAQMDAVYKSLVMGRFCALRHESRSPDMSPHYGSRSVTVYVGEHWFEVRDAGGHLLDKPSNTRFYQMADTITSAGRAAAPAASSAAGTMPPFP